MSNLFELDAEMRKEIGKGASRRLRRKAGLVPAIIYGAGKEPLMITLPHNKVIRSLEEEAFFSKVLIINIGKEKESVILQALQRHPFKNMILHMDFLRINANEELYKTVPLHFIGGDAAPGVKVGGGAPIHYMKEVAIHCLPKDLPEYIAIDLSSLEINDVIHLSDLQLPKNVTLDVDLSDEDNNVPVATIQTIKAAEEEPEVAAAPVETEITTAKAETKEANNEKK